MGYLLFVGSYYYPSGGVMDYSGSFETIEACHEKLKELKRGNDWWQIVDHSDMYVCDTGSFK